MYVTPDYAKERGGEPGQSPRKDHPHSERIRSDDESMDAKEGFREKSFRDVIMNLPTNYHNDSEDSSLYAKKDVRKPLISQKQHYDVTSTRKRCSSCSFKSVLLNLFLFCIMAGLIAYNYMLSQTQNNIIDELKD